MILAIQNDYVMDSIILWCYYGTCRIKSSLADKIKYFLNSFRGPIFTARIRPFWPLLTYHASNYFVGKRLLTFTIIPIINDTVH